MSSAVDVASFVLIGALATLIALWCAYLGLALLLSRRASAPSPSTRSLRVDIVIPAHDEAAVIARCLASLKCVDWPHDRYRVIVIADNCTDTTAEIAREAGVLVLDRASEQRAKGYALQSAFRFSQREGWADAVAVIDADSVVSTNLIDAFAARIERGAYAVQVRYGVLNTAASWRTRLMAIAQGAFHDVRSRARERLRLSCGIRGNGWCVTHALLNRVPYAAFSLVEDLEYGIDLGLAGFRVHYADEAGVFAEAASASTSARAQRQRWEWGRAELRSARAWSLLSEGIRRPSRVCIDLALDLLVPPLSRIASAAAMLVLGTLLLTWMNPLFSPLLWIALACIGVLSLYVLRGWSLSGTGVRGLIDLACAPAFVIWKALAVRGARAAHVWVRTDREKS